MTWYVRCYRIFENRRGFNDYEPRPEWDSCFDTAEEAMRYMSVSCGASCNGHAFVFDIEEVDE